MLFVNIFHENNNLLEYIFVSLFFKFFGIAVYNNIFYDTINHLDLSNEFVPINLFIANKNNINSVNNFKQLHAIITGYDDDYFVNENTIRFPKSLTVDAVTDFFNALIQSISAALKQNNLYNEFEEFDKNRESLINIFIQANPMVNWYIAKRVIKDRYFSRMTIARLIKSYKDTADSVSEYAKYAHVNIGYMANHLCTRDQYVLNIEWDDLISKCDALDPNLIEYRSICFMLARLYEESGKNSALSEVFYDKSCYKYGYYSYYRRARLYEFQYNNPKVEEMYLQQSIEYNSNYYRAAYKLGFMEDEWDMYGNAYMHYSNVLAILQPRMDDNCWCPLDMEYYLKACGKIMGLNRYFHINKTMRCYSKMAEKLMKSVEKNKFLRQLAEFVVDDINDDKVWYTAILHDVINNAKDHYDKYCGVYSFN